MPFNMHTIEQMWGVRTAEEAQKKIESQKEGIALPSNLEEQAIYGRIKIWSLLLQNVRLGIRAGCRSRTRRSAGPSGAGA